MSRNIFVTDKLQVKAFWGGSKRGPMIQLVTLTIDSYSQFDRAEILALVEVLNNWLSETKEPKWSRFRLFLNFLIGRRCP